MPYYKTQEFAAEIRKPPETVRYWRKIGYGPSWFKVGRTVLYDVAEVDAWIAQLRAETTSGRVA